jgi:hypothetical protein
MCVQLLPYRPFFAVNKVGQRKSRIGNEWAAVPIKFEFQSKNGRS